MTGTRGKAVRLAVSAAALLLLLLGTVRGDDHDFPFGPFRMYATTNQPDGIVNSYRVEGTDASGADLFVSGAATGLRRAEIEGQTSRYLDDPSLLGKLAVAYARRRPERPPLVEVRLVVRRYQLRDGRRTSEVSEDVVARWRTGS